MSTKPRLAPAIPGSEADFGSLMAQAPNSTSRFFELYAETWRRSILNLRGEKRWRDWAAQIRPTQIPYLARVLHRTQRSYQAPAPPAHPQPDRDL